MISPLPFPSDPRLLEIYELGARMTVADSQVVRLNLWGNMRAKIDAYLRDTTATAYIGKKTKTEIRG